MTDELILKRKIYYVLHLMNATHNPIEKKIYEEEFNRLDDELIKCKAKTLTKKRSSK